MKKDITQLQKLAHEAPKYILVSNQFGTNVYVADNEITGGIQITDKKEEALHFSVGFDNEEMKLKYWRSLTGINFQVQQV